MSMNVSPLFNSPATDLVGLMGHHQHFGRCAKFEMQMMECMEAYGADMSKVKCKDLIDDFDECHTQKKQVGLCYIFINCCCRTCIVFISGAKIN